MTFLLSLPTHWPHHTNSTEWGSVAEWAAAIVALAALVASIAAVVIARNIARNTDLLHLHEYLMSKDVQAGRREMHKVIARGGDWERVKKRKPQQFDAINHALSAYQRLAQYTRLGYVPKDRALRLWSDRISAAWPSIESFISWRRKEEGYEKSWESLVWFAREGGANVTID